MAVNRFIGSRELAGAAALGSGLIAVIALVEGTVPLLIVSGITAVAIAAVVAPELVLALLVTVSGFKAAPWLSFLPGDPTVFAAFAVIAAMAAEIGRRGMPPLPPPVYFAVALAVIVLASVAWTPAPGAGLDKAFRFVVLTELGLWAPLVLIRTEHSFRWLMVGLAGFGLLIALTSQPTGNPTKPLTVVGGNLTNQIDLALYAAVGLIAATYLIIRGEGILRWVGIVAAPVLAFFVYAAGSRGILIGAVIALVYFAFARAKRRARLRIGAVCLVAIAGVFVIGPHLAGESASRYQHELFSASPADILGQRAYIYKAASSLAVSHPFGIGSGGFAAVTGGIVYPHNVELELAAEYGLISVALFLALIASAWAARRRAVRIGWKTQSAVVGALIILLFIDAQVSHDLTSTRPLWLALGLALALPRLKSPPATGAEIG